MGEREWESNSERECDGKRSNGCLSILTCISRPLCDVANVCACIIACEDEMCAWYVCMYVCMYVRSMCNCKKRKEHIHRL